jgi:hypothetical protein
MRRPTGVARSLGRTLLASSIPFALAACVPEGVCECDHPGPHDAATWCLQNRTRCEFVENVTKSSADARLLPHARTGDPAGNLG